MAVELPAVAVMALALLREQPAHPYEVFRTLEQRCDTRGDVLPRGRRGRHEGVVVAHQLGDERGDVLGERMRESGIVGDVDMATASGVVAAISPVPGGVGPLTNAILMQHLLEAAAGHDLKAYGVEALGALRIEKGHVAGPEIDGRTTLADLGMARMVARRSGYVGEALSRRAAFLAPNRQRIVGLQCVEPGKRLRGGAILFAPGDPRQGHGRGRVTSTTFSPELGGSIGLGLLAADVTGEEVVAVYPMKNEEIRAKLVSPVFLDPAGERMHG